jgi:hypothetical protein
MSEPQNGRNDDPGPCDQNDRHGAPETRPTSPSYNPDRPEIERRGNVVFWVTLAAGLAVVVLCVILPLTV